MWGWAVAGGSTVLSILLHAVTVLQLQNGCCFTNFQDAHMCWPSRNSRPLHPGLHTVKTESVPLVTA